MSVLQSNLNEPTSWSTGCKKLGHLYTVNIFLLVGILFYLSMVVVEAVMFSPAVAAATAVCEAERCVSSTLSTFVVAFLAGGLMNMDVLKSLPIL